MITKIVRNKPTDKIPDIETLSAIKEKLEYYRAFIPLLAQMEENQLSELQSDIRQFFNLIPVHSVKTPPPYLFRISSNDRILGKGVDFLRTISQLLAPPTHLCNYNRCNIPGERVLYCASDEITTYWETKPKKGETITISIYKAKEGQTINIGRIGTKKMLQIPQNLS